MYVFECPDKPETNARVAMFCMVHAAKDLALARLGRSYSDDHGKAKGIGSEALAKDFSPEP